MWCYKINYNHDGENAVMYILTLEKDPDKVKVRFYNYLRSLDVSFLIHKVEIVDEVEAVTANMNKYHFCFLNKEEY